MTKQTPEKKSKGGIILPEPERSGSSQGEAAVIVYYQSGPLTLYFGGFELDRQVPGCLVPAWADDVDAAKRMSPLLGQRMIQMLKRRGEPGDMKLRLVDPGDHDLMWPLVSGWTVNQTGELWDKREDQDALRAAIEQLYVTLNNMNRGICVDPDAVVRTAAMLDRLKDISTYLCGGVPTPGEEYT